MAAQRLEPFKLREDYVPPVNTDIVPFELEMNHERPAIDSEMSAPKDPDIDAELRLLRVENDCLRQQLTDVRHQYDQRLSSISTAVGRLHRENGQISKQLDLMFRMVEQLLTQGRQDADRFNNAMIRLSSMYPQLHYPFIPTRMPHLNSPGTSPSPLPVRMPEISTSVIRHRSQSSKADHGVGRDEANDDDEEDEERNKRKAREDEDDLASNAMWMNF